MNYLVDPDNITRFGLSKPELELVLLFWVCAAGKKAKTADPKAITYAAHQRVFEDMATAVASGRSPAVSGAEARKSVELILAIYQSALAGGAPVTLPLARTPGLHAFDQADTRRLESSPR